MASSPNVVNPGGGCPRLWFLGSPVLNFAWEFLYEVSSHQKDTCAKQEGNRAFFFFLPGVHLKPDATRGGR